MHGIMNEEFLHLWNFNEVFNSQIVMTYFLVKLISEHTKIHLGLNRRKPFLVACKQQTADQPVHAHSLISVFVTCTLKGIIPKLVTCQISIF